MIPHSCGGATLKIILSHFEKKKPVLVFRHNTTTITRPAIATMLPLKIFFLSFFFVSRDLFGVLSCTESQQMTLGLLTLLPNCDEIETDLLSVAIPQPNDDKSLNFHSTFRYVVEMINNSSELLPCHKLKLICKEDGCNNRVDKTMESLVSGLFPRDRNEVVGILGPVCSESAENVVYVASQPEIRMIVLSNEASTDLENYANAVSILGSIRSLVDLALHLVDSSEWLNLSILYENSEYYYRNIKDVFLAELARRGVRVATKLHLSPYYYALNKIRKSRVRIVIVFASIEYPKRLMCIAHHMGIVYPTYQWVIVSHSLPDFRTNHNIVAFTDNGTEYQCTADQLLSAFEKSFLIGYEVLTTSEMYPFVNIPFAEIRGRESTMPPYWTHSFYDAVWAWAIVLHNLVINNTEVVFSYGNASLADMILDQFYNLSFEGMSGKISFGNYYSHSGMANRQGYLYQVNNGKLLAIGTSNSKTLTSFIRISDHMKNVEVPSEGYVGFFITLAGLVLITVIILHVMTVIYRKEKTVKANSPKLIQLSFIGCYLFTVTIVLNCISWMVHFGQETDAALCQIIWTWLLPVSFTLTMGIVTVRSWRLYRIFVHYLNPGRFISNSSLITTVLVLASVDIVIAIVWTSVDPIQFRYFEMTVKNGSEDEVLLVPECYSSYLWLGLIYLYKISLLLALIVLTILTRNIPKFNAAFTTSHLHMFTYSFSAVFVIGLSLYHIFALVIRSNLYAEFITISSVLSTFLILFVSFLIIPPLLPIFRKVNSVTVAVDFS